MKKTRVWYALGLALLMTIPVSAQDTPETPPEPAPGSTPERPVSWKQILPNFLDDQKHIWLFPLQVVGQGKHILPVAGVVGTTAALLALDPVEAPYFRKKTFYSGFNRGFGSYTTTAEILAIPAAFYVAGLVWKDSHAKNTGLLAAEAAADVEIPNLVLRTTFRRLRPIDVAPQGNYSDTWFDSGTNPLKAPGSFPSGHTAAAFAVATVISRRYPTKRWVPLIAYSAAAMIGFSRLTLSTHFVSDVFFGAALGYSVGRFVVLRQ